MKRQNMAEGDSRKSPPEVDTNPGKEPEDVTNNEKSDLGEELEVKRVHYVPSIPECVVCLQPCYHPVKLKCDHIFCFLCVKGVAARSHRCALCRAEVQDNYFESPIVVKVRGEQDDVSLDQNLVKSNDCLLYKWFYEGRNGWWQYEDRASDQIEEAFSEGKQAIEIPIAGFGYIIDIENMVQYRKNYPTRRRRIKRDKYQADKKGVAGLKYGKEKQNDSELVENAEQKQDLAVGKTNSNHEEPEIDVKSLSEKLEKTL